MSHAVNRAALSSHPCGVLQRPRRLCRPWRRQPHSWRRDAAVFCPEDWL